MHPPDTACLFCVIFEEIVSRDLAAVLHNFDAATAQGMQYKMMRLLMALALASA
jgi:hypothetical protein